MGTHVLEDDMYYVYGNAFGIKNRVIVITKNHKVMEKRSVVDVSFEKIF